MDLPQQPQWTPTDAAGIDQFLSTPLGQKWLGFLQRYKPRLTQENIKGIEGAALMGAYSAGYELCLINIYTSTRAADDTDYTTRTADMTRD